MDNTLKNNIKKTRTVYEKIVNTLVEPSFHISDGHSTYKALEGFLEKLGGFYGYITDERIVDYCVFAAYRYRNTPAIQKVKQAFGTTAIQTFIKSSSIERFCENKWIASGKLSRNDLIQMINITQRQHPHAQYLYMASEEQTKLRMHNRQVGFVLCQSSTLGWSPLSEACKSCDYIADCKTLTQKKYPEIFRLREEYEQAHH